MAAHPNIKDVRTTVEIDNEADWKTVVEVVTDLRLNPAHPDYDESAVTSLVETTVEWGAANEMTWDVLRMVEQK